MMMAIAISPISGKPKLPAQDCKLTQQAWKKESRLSRRLSCLLWNSIDQRVCILYPAFTFVLVFMAALLSLSCIAFLDVFLGIRFEGGLQIEYSGS
jgi:hypothetical protein